MPPLPQIKAFLEISFCRTALGQPVGAYVIYVGSPPGMREQFHFLRNGLRPPPCQEGQSWFLEEAPAGESLRTRV